MRDSRQARATDLIALIEEAGDRIYGLVQATPVAELPHDRVIPATTRAYAKLEQLQTTGSFKLRGAANKLMSLTPEAASAGVVTSSTGNHGLAVAAAAQHCKIDAEVYLSTQVSAAKLKKIASYGAHIQLAGQHPLDAELAARAAAGASGRTYVSPYNDWHVVAGQGTIAVELLRQIDSIDAVFIATGGGGLIGGIGTYLRKFSPQTEIVGCWPQNSRVLYECMQAGKIIEYPETYTLSESTAGGVEPRSITFDLARAAMHRGVLVSEDAILDAMKWARDRGWTIEGAAGVALAAFFQEASRYEGKTVVVIFCGGNLSPEVQSRCSENFTPKRVFRKGARLFRYAIVRRPGENFADGLTTAEFGTPDLSLALSQHEAYCEALESCGLELIRLPADLRHPDSTFVEDAAVLTSHSAILTRPGAPSRRGELDGLRETIGRFFSSVHEVTARGTLDGGDICEAGTHVFIGISNRTNEEGAHQLSHWLVAEGFTTSLVDIRSLSSILHLKSGIAYLENNDLVVMEELAGREEFTGYNRISVPTEESYACNCLLVNDRVLVPAGFPRLQTELASRGYEPVPLDMSEFRKMDGGLSCLSLRF